LFLADRRRAKRADQRLSSEGTAGRSEGPERQSACRLRPYTSNVSASGNCSSDWRVPPPMRFDPTILLLRESGPSWRTPTLSRDLSQVIILPRNESESRFGLAAKVLSYVILGAGAATIIVAVYVAVLGHSKLPFWDDWMEIDFAANEGAGHTLDWLWRQFNQHRVIIPKLFLLADLRWFRATQTFLTVSCLVLQFSQLCLLGWSLRVFGGWRGNLWRTAVGLLAFCLFCPSQWPNFLLGMTGLCFFLPPLFASLSFAGLILWWRNCGGGSLFLLQSI